MRLNWRGWSYDLFQSLIRSMGVAGSAWLGISVKYKELNLEDLAYCMVFGAVARTLFHFMENRPLPEDIDATKPVETK